MSRLATAFVLGFHGCDRTVAESAIGGEIDILQSDKDFDWLGPGAYFWESDPQRALEWAREKSQRADIRTPAVVGAVIDLRNCLDISSRTDLGLLEVAYQSFAQMQRVAGLTVPENKNLPGQMGSDQVLRYLDCAVIRHLHSILDGQPVEEREVEPFDTVRGLFEEGDALYPGSAFKRKSHVQIAVRNAECIRGVFWPRPPVEAPIDDEDLEAALSAAAPNT